MQQRRRRRRRASPDSLVIGMPRARSSSATWRAATRRRARARPTPRTRRSRRSRASATPRSRARAAESANSKLRADVKAARARASDPAALRRLKIELAKARADITTLARDNARLQDSIAAARTAVEKARREYGELWLPHRPRGAGAGRGRPHDEKTRRTYQALIAEGLCHPSKCNTIFTICAEAICLRKCEREMELPDVQFALGLREEMGAVHRMLVGRALEASERIASLQSDGTPLEQRQFLTAPMQVDERPVARDDERCWRFQLDVSGPLSWAGLIGTI